jgi:type VI secretion system secreted protein Hcp
VAACNGTRFPQAIFTLRSAGGTPPVEFYKVTLSDVVISGVRPGGHTGTDIPFEEVSLNFGKIEIRFTPQTSTGQAGVPVVGRCDTHR